jgi:hypothetical protein
MNFFGGGKEYQAWLGELWRIKKLPFIPGEVRLRVYIKNKKPHVLLHRVSFLKNGIDLLSQALGQLPSAQPGLTSLFGMGRGAPRRHRHHKVIIIN